jgi:hypothetical protein
MAPEQASGEADFRSDVYSLGGLLKALIAPLPKPLGAVAAKATARERTERFASAREISDEVARYLDGEPLLSYKAPITERAARWISKNRALVAIVAAYLLMRVIVFFTTSR